MKKKNYADESDWLEEEDEEEIENKAKEINKNQTNMVDEDNEMDFLDAYMKSIESKKKKFFILIYFF